MVGVEGSAAPALTPLAPLAPLELNELARLNFIVPCAARDALITACWRARRFAEDAAGLIGSSGGFAEAGFRARNLRPRRRRRYQIKAQQRGSSTSAIKPNKRWSGS